ncbi:MAG: hypothetical protein NTW14_13600 [bacterium]|nr:hypothetical protein [bacterium]
MMRKLVSTAAILLMATIVLLTTAPLAFARTPHQPAPEAKLAPPVQSITIHIISPLFPSSGGIMIQFPLPWIKGDPMANPAIVKPIPPEKPGVLDGGESGFIRNGGM